MKLYFLSPDKEGFLLFNKVIPCFYNKLNSTYSIQSTVSWNTAVFPSKQGKLNNFTLKP